MHPGGNTAQYESRSEALQSQRPPLLVLGDSCPRVTYAQCLSEDWVLRFCSFVHAEYSDFKKQFTLFKSPKFVYPKSIQVQVCVLMPWDDSLTLKEMPEPFLVSRRAGQLLE